MWFLHKDKIQFNCELMRIREHIFSYINSKDTERFGSWPYFRHQIKA